MATYPRSLGLVNVLIKARDGVVEDSQVISTNVLRLNFREKEALHSL
jgi:hypothetical protein